MKSEDHIHFLSELLHQANELIATIREYCDEVINDDEKITWQRDNNKQENEPF